MSTQSEVKQTESKKHIQPQSRRQFFLSLQWKLLIGFTLLFSVVFAIAFYWFYTFATNAALTRIQDDLVATLEGATEGVKTDELLSLAANGKPNSQGFSDDPRFIDQLNWLDTVHHIEPRAWPYIYVRGPQENQIFYVVDLFAKYDPSRSTQFMESKISKGFSLQGFEGLTLRTVDGRFDTYKDEWGRWVSAYAPIKDQSGKVVAAMGVDFEADYVDQVRQSILDKVTAAFLLTYAGLFLLVFLVSRTLTRPIQGLTDAAERLGEGDYEQDLFKTGIAGRFEDEIDKLARVFGIMADKVYQREQTLRRQVEALKIEIDETKRQKQVSEIAETDFFRELQAKARKMRSRQKSDNDDDSSGS